MRAVWCVHLSVRFCVCVRGGGEERDMRREGGREKEGTYLGGVAVQEDNLAYGLIPDRSERVVSTQTKPTKKEDRRGGCENNARRLQRYTPRLQKLPPS